MRMHHSFKDAGKNPFAQGYALIDPDAPDRVLRDARRFRNTELIWLGKK